jgi:hypothetical protein
MRNCSRVTESFALHWRIGAGGIKGTLLIPLDHDRIFQNMN